MNDHVSLSVDKVIDEIFALFGKFQNAGDLCAYSGQNCHPFRFKPATYVFSNAPC